MLRVDANYNKKVSQFRVLSPISISTLGAWVGWSLTVMSVETRIQSKISSLDKAGKIDRSLEICYKDGGVYGRIEAPVEYTRHQVINDP